MVHGEEAGPPLHMKTLPLASFVLLAVTLHAPVFARSFIGHSVE